MTLHLAWAAFVLALMARLLGKVAECPRCCAVDEEVGGAAMSIIQ